MLRTLIAALLAVGFAACGRACDECSTGDPSYPRCEGDTVVFCGTPRDAPCTDPILCPPQWALNATFDHNMEARYDCGFSTDATGAKKHCAVAATVETGPFLPTCIDATPRPCSPPVPGDTCPPDGDRYACIILKDSGQRVDNFMGKVCLGDAVCHASEPTFECVLPPLLACDPLDTPSCSADAGAVQRCVGSEDAGYVISATPCPLHQQCDAQADGGVCVAQWCDPSQHPTQFCSLPDRQTVLECRSDGDAGYIFVTADCFSRKCGTNDAGYDGCL